METRTYALYEALRALVENWKESVEMLHEEPAYRVLCNCIEMDEDFVCSPCYDIFEVLDLMVMYHVDYERAVMIWKEQNIKVAI